MVFSDFWTGWAVKTILAPKFGSPVQRWGRAGLGGSGAATKSWAPASLLATRGCPPQSGGLPVGRRLAFPIIGPPNMGGGQGPPHNCPPSRGAWGGDFRGGWGALGRGSWGGRVGSMHHPLPWLPPQTSFKTG
jgi:hypothetical protein